MDDKQIDNIFTYHAPKGTQADRYVTIREAARVFCKIINELTPESREKSISITKLQECVQMANASIAINEK